MPYRKVGYLEQSWYIVKGGFKELLSGRAFKHPYKQVRTKQPDGSFLTTWEPKRRKQDERKDRTREHRGDRNG